MTDWQWQGTQASPEAVASPVTQEERAAASRRRGAAGGGGKPQAPSAIRGHQEWGRGTRKSGLDLIL